MKNIPSSTLKIIAFLSSAILLNSCANETTTVAEEHHHSAQTVELNAAQYKSADIKTGKAELRNLSNVIACNGVLDVPPQNLISISLPIGGNLKSTSNCCFRTSRLCAVAARIYSGKISFRF